ncbi:hypothetical protein MasN3_30860 [Massilia varians]|uniref:UspA domain-containing protein n=1 Tax=Massilia varians TaxID=457921 RepID=A0ABN6TBI0_9BURK|nr:universal stress protein [Massilia varians]BDT59592.1 hypothetical protein MasN3_30860 [Massilia varians]
MYKRILVPTDGSPVAQAAVDAAIDLARAAARQRGCDLIAMGSHGRRWIGRLLAGSVTQALLAYAPVPVMVLRPVVGDTRAPAYAQAPAGPWPAPDPG